MSLGLIPAPAKPHTLVRIVSPERSFDAPLRAGLVSGTPMARASLPVRLPLLLAILLAASFAWAVPHRGGSHLRDQIEALEEQWRQAALAEDTEKMDRLLADDFLGITASGQVVTKMQQLDRMRTRQVTLSRLDVSDMKIKLIGQHVAIVTSLAEVEGSNDQRPLHGSYRYTRVYRRSPNGTWKITSFEATHIPHHLAQQQGEPDQQEPAH